LNNPSKFTTPQLEQLRDAKAEKLAAFKRRTIHSTAPEAKRAFAKIEAALVDEIATLDAEIKSR
jgi:hypothetical protein